MSLSNYNHLKMLNTTITKSKHKILNTTAFDMNTVNTPNCIMVLTANNSIYATFQTNTNKHNRKPKIHIYSRFGFANMQCCLTVHVQSVIKRFPYKMNGAEKKKIKWMWRKPMEEEDGACSRREIDDERKAIKGRRKTGHGPHLLKKERTKKIKKKTNEMNIK